MIDTWQKVRRPPEKGRLGRGIGDEEGILAGVLRLPRNSLGALLSMRVYAEAVPPVVFQAAIRPALSRPGSDGQHNNGHG